MKQHIATLGSPGPKVPPSQGPGSRYNGNYSEGGDLEILHVQHQDPAFPRRSRHHSPYSQESVHIFCPVFSSPNAILPAFTGTPYLSPCSHRCSTSENTHTPRDLMSCLPFNSQCSQCGLSFRNHPCRSVDLCSVSTSFIIGHLGLVLLPLTLPMSSEPDAIPGVLHQDWEDSRPHVKSHLARQPPEAGGPDFKVFLLHIAQKRPMRCNRVEFPTQVTRRPCFSLAKLLLFQDHGRKSG